MNDQEENINSTNNEDIPVAYMDPSSTTVPTGSLKHTVLFAISNTNQSMTHC